jgi:hypothetical protein
VFCFEISLNSNQKVIKNYQKTLCSDRSSLNEHRHLLRQKVLQASSCLKVAVTIGTRDWQNWHFLPTSGAKPIKAVVASLTEQLSRTTWAIVHGMFPTQRL